MFRLKNNTIPEAFENKFEIVHHLYPTSIAKTTPMDPKYISRLPSLQYLQVDHVSGIALLIKIQRQLLQPYFLKENLKTI